MNSKNKEVNYLVHLMACALNEKEPQVLSEDIDFSVLLELAKKHQIYNMIFPVISNMENVPEEEKENWRNYNLTEIAKMLTVNSERQIIYDELTENKIKFMALKGLILKNYYPKESMRQMSDNDILVDPKKRDLIFEIMKRHNYKISSTCENSDDFLKSPFCAFEFHRDLFFDECEFHPHFNYVWDNAVVDEENPYMYYMNLNDVYVHSVCHMYKHFSTAGCGVRFLADIYVFLKKEKDNLDWNYVNNWFSEYGILEYEKESRELAFKLFDEEELNDKQMELFQTYMNFGIYGNGNVAITRRINKLAENDNSSLKTAKTKYLLKRLFPSKSLMVQNYRVLEKKPYLLPFYYVARLFKGLFESKKVINEVKLVNDFESENNKTK